MPNSGEPVQRALLKLPTLRGLPILGVQPREPANRKPEPAERRTEGLEWTHVASLAFAHIFERVHAVEHSSAEDIQPPADAVARFMDPDPFAHLQPRPAEHRVEAHRIADASRRLHADREGIPFGVTREVDEN